ncbi:MAG: pyrroline-5-carboxylate reductase [Variovorax sp.]
MRADDLPALAFIGGGNMASAIIGGLRRAGVPAAQFEVVEPFDAARTRLAEAFGIAAQPQASSALARCRLIIWAVKPQAFAQAAAPVRTFTRDALHLSVAAGITSGSIERWLANERIVRAMPNTPALIGRGMTGLYARGAVSAGDRMLVEQVLASTGELLWFDDEAALDAVTAVSGSGPAYVFYFLEAMTEAGVQMGLPANVAHRLALGTLAGAAALAGQSDEAPAVLRERVTSKGGTTYAAISAMQSASVKEQIMKAMHAARQRAEEMAREFGSS